MKKLSQRELLQEVNFADMVRAAGRVAADIYAPVIKPIKDALNAWESPTKALVEFVKTTPHIRILEIISGPEKVGGKAKYTLPMRGTGKGNYGTNIYQIWFTAEVYDKTQGFFKQHSSTTGAPNKNSQQLRADIQRVNGKYTVQGIYDMNGESLGIKSTPTKTSPEDLVKDLFDGDSDYTFKFIKYINQFKVNKQTGVTFKAYYNSDGNFDNSTPQDDYVAIVTANNKAIVKVYKASDRTQTPIQYYTKLS